MALAAGNNTNLLASGSRQTSNNGQSHTSSGAISSLSSGGDLSVRAGQDINTQAASVNATGDLALNAGRDINIASATASDYRYDEKTTTSKHLFSSTTTHTIKEDYATHEQGSQLGGNHISLAAGRDIGVVGSSIAGDSNVTLKAGNNVAIVAATENQTHYQLKETKKSGLMGGGGLGISIGKQSSKS